ncbi:FAD binding domain-containing protein [Sphaerosporella brunnea]|uniref:FAD binding domain-containing protein n=1 Tax=Sphaerosporella brunnea TaxID=1250544 RepID=A0A5J5EIR8_9PEZI|nr:FAD binding domain-containing protein [Sphaerosporella brunnea]
MRIVLVERRLHCRSGVPRVYTTETTPPPPHEIGINPVFLPSLWTIDNLPEPMMHFGIIVIGAGNAGYSAATTAAQHGVQNVLLIEKGPEGTGGNTYFTAGAFRTVFRGLEDVLPLVCNVTPAQAAKIDMQPYTEQNFLDDLARVTDGRADPVMAETLVRHSRDAIAWLSLIGVQFTLSFNRQAYEVNGRQKFWGGMVLSVKDGGKGLVQDHQRAAKNAGVSIWFETPALALITNDSGAVIGVTVLRYGKPTDLYSTAVVLACGGFEANPQMRAQYLGPGWDLAYVRGTPYNNGDGFRMTNDLAKAIGNWSGCHSTAWDATAPKDAGDPVLTNAFTKSGYPLGIMVNSAGKRFVDEGVDFRNYTYAKFGREILKQPGGIAFQIWDDRTIGWLRKEEYGGAVLREKVVAHSLEELAQKLFATDQVSQDAFLRTIEEYNQAVRANREQFPGRKWNPAMKDGLSTQSSFKRLSLPKSNWALPIDQAPFLAVKVTCGITFTFGGLKIEPETAAVISKHNENPIPGLFCCGEMVGGLFWGNYPGGSGLTAGTVWGRKAGANSAKSVRAGQLQEV